MAKVTIEFDPQDDNSDVRQILHVREIDSAMFEFENWLRGKWKWGEENIAVDEVWEAWHSYAGENELGIRSGKKKARYVPFFIVGFVFFVFGFFTCFVAF